MEIRKRSGHTIHNLLTLKVKRSIERHMGQIARVVVPDCPHHIAQRENPGQQTSFCEEDCRAYVAVDRSVATPS